MLATQSLLKGYSSCSLVQPLDNCSFLMGLNWKYVLYKEPVNMVLKVDLHVWFPRPISHKASAFLLKQFFFFS